MVSARRLKWNIRGLFPVLVLAGAFSATQLSAVDTVRVWEEAVTFPTWRTGEPELMPVWKVRGGKIYPYPMFDKLTEERAPQTYRGLWLENEYVRALVLPEIGGRLHDAFDKTAGGYHFLQDQRTIKPALVGMGGAWISGGIEWNFPHGHRPSGFRHVDWRLAENPDGSKTVWTGEIERTCGMRWAVGNTVHPGRTWVETRVRLFNSTPFPQSFLWWADAGVRGSPEFQAVIPGEIATSHGKHEFYRWPHHEGKDLRRWENAPGGTSYFIVGSQEDFQGSYTPEEQGGLVHWADHHVVRGKKLWFCGTSPAGRLWEVVLTDGDAPLVEPQAGAYSDNQPDYHWILPGETKTFSHFWFPVRNLGYWDYANLEGAVNLELEKGRVKAGWSPTGHSRSVTVFLHAGDRELYRRTLDASPGEPVLIDTPARELKDLHALRLAVLSASGDTLIAFSHPRPADLPLPVPDQIYPSPEKIETSEILFLAGDYHERFREQEKAEACYREALRRDPGDVRCNTALGVMLLKRGKYAEAALLLETALSRDKTVGQASYHLGLARLEQGLFSVAESDLARSSYDLTYYSVSNLRLACLAGSRGDWEKTLDYARRAVRGNGDNSEARGMLALALNRLGSHAEALEVAVRAQAEDPLDFLSASERASALKGMGRTVEAAAAVDTLRLLLRGDSYNLIELAIRYARCGLYRDASNVLNTHRENLSPLGLYYLAWYAHHMGDENREPEFLAQAASADPAYCFPSRLESLPVLEWASATSTGDGQAPYLLGNLYFSLGRREEAIAFWERAVSRDAANVVAWRNLGYARAEAGDLEGARAAYEGAVAADPRRAVPLTEMDEVLDRLEAPREERLALLEAHRETVLSTDPSVKRLVSLYVQLGRCDDALETLSGHRFHSWEGGYDIHRYWVEANLMKGDIQLEQGQAVEALESYRRAMTYPDNLEVKAQPGVLYTREHYKIGIALEALGQARQAYEQYSLVAADSLDPGNARQYFRGMALARMGHEVQASEIFSRLLESAAESEEEQHGGLEDGLPHAEKTPLALARYKRALAMEGLGRYDLAESLHEEALTLDPIVPLRAFGPPRAGW